MKLEGKVLGRFVKYERLKTLSSQLLPNDNLTIVCDVTIFGERKPVLYCNEEQLENGDVSQDLGNAFTSKELCDVQLQCGEKIFDCHKVILSARSPVFRAMFQAEMEEKKTNKVDINDLDPDILAEMLHFIYTGKTPKLDDFAGQLLGVADRYQIEKLKIICEEFLCMSLNVENCVDLLITGDLYNADNLKRFSLKFISRNGIKSSDWKETLKKYPTLMLEVIDALNH